MHFLYLFTHWYLQKMSKNDITSLQPVFADNQSHDMQNPMRFDVTDASLFAIMRAWVHEGMIFIDELNQFVLNVIKAEWCIHVRSRFKRAHVLEDNIILSPWYNMNEINGTSAQLDWLSYWTAAHISGFCKASRKNPWGKEKTVDTVSASRLCSSYFYSLFSSSSFSLWKLKPPIPTFIATSTEKQNPTLVFWSPFLPPGWIRLWQVSLLIDFFWALLLGNLI